MRARSRIVADGPFSPLSGQRAETRARLVAEARKRRAGDLRDASILGRVRLELAIEREVRAELDRIFPPGALYAAAQRRGHG
jgi:hypothetical protein